MKAVKKKRTSMFLVGSADLGGTNAKYRGNERIMHGSLYDAWNFLIALYFK